MWPDWRSLRKQRDGKLDAADPQALITALPMSSPLHPLEEDPNPLKTNSL